MRRQSPPPRYFWTVGGSSRIHGQTFIVLTLPPLFLITVIFIRILKLKKELGTPQFYFFADGGSSRIQGHTFIVFTLPLLFFTTVIFMARSLCARGAPNVLRKWVNELRYRRVSTTTSTSQGRSVPFFFGFCVFLPFM